MNSRREQEKQVKFIRGSAQDLTELVNDLLDLAKVEAGKVSIRAASFKADGVFRGAARHVPAIAEPELFRESGF